MVQLSHAVEARRAGKTNSDFELATPQYHLASGELAK
jgi:hypothetical protein